MSLATTIGALLLILHPLAEVRPQVLASQAQAEQGQAPASAPDQKSAPPPAAPSQTKPCAESSATKPAASSDCTPVKKKLRKRKPKPATSDSGKTVVRNGSTAEPSVAISPGVNQQQVSRQVEITNQWLTKTEANLKAMEARQLNASQQDTVRQITSYVEQAQAALKNGDVQRAYNLARKANTLSGDLVAH